MTPVAARPNFLNSYATFPDGLGGIAVGSDATGILGAVYNFSGVPNAPFTEFAYPLPYMAQWTAVSAGGNSSARRAVLGGGSVAFNLYFLAAEGLALPAIVPQWVNQSNLAVSDVRLTPDGVHAAAVGTGLPVVLVSHTGGESYSAVNITVDGTGLPNVTTPTAVVIATPETLFVTLSAPVGSGPGFFYSTGVAKSEDGGATWAVVLAMPQANFSFVDIDCFNATHCVAIGNGEPLDISPGGAWAYATADGGATWQNTLALERGPRGRPHLHTVRFSGSLVPEVFMGGTLKVHYSINSWQGMLWTSTSAGAAGSWSQVPLSSDMDIGSFTKLSFAAGGATGFALVMRRNAVTTILRYEAIGPLAATFTETLFTDAACSAHAHDVSWPQARCIPLRGRFVVATCAADRRSVAQRVYATQDCSGPFTTEVIPTDTCRIVDGLPSQLRCEI